MKSILAFAILGAVMYVCGLGEGTKIGDSTPPATPTASPRPDKQTVQNELVKLENDLTEAGANGDITVIARNTTDDFELTGVNGKTQNKNQALADVKKEKNIKSWTITEPELLSFSDDSAVLRYVQNVTLKTGQSGRARVTDSFVKKDGRWMIRSEQQTMMR